MRPGGSFFATFYERGEDTPLDAIFAADKPKPFYHEKNAYWYRRSDLEWATGSGPWRLNYIGDWGHPSGQKMVEFIRLTDEEAAAARTLAGEGRAEIKRLRALLKKSRAQTREAQAGVAASHRSSSVDHARKVFARGLRAAAHRVDR